MGLRIKTNIESLMSQRQLGESRSMMQDSLVRLSSGKRINKSADDAAGLAVSETMNAKIRSLGQAKRNANDGISFVQVAEGGLSELNNMVTRMRELTTQAASDTIGSEERGFLNREFTQLSQEVGRVISETEFNGKKVLSSEEAPEGGLAIHVGANSHAGKKSDGEGDVIRIKFDQVKDLNDAIKELQSINIEGESGQELGGGSTPDIFAKIDTSMRKITDFRATIGAVQSRLNTSINSIDVSMENLAAAQSRIRDVDYAAETARLTQSKILAAAGTSVLSQANSTPESVLQLLR